MTQHRSTDHSTVGDGLDTHPEFTVHDLDPVELTVYRSLTDQYENGEIPDTYRLQWISHQSALFAREDALPVPENESNGAAVEIDYNQDESHWWVTLYHEDGAQQMGILKGYGASCCVDSLDDAIVAACEAMQLDDQLAVADPDELTT